MTFEFEPDPKYGEHLKEKPTPGPPAPGGSVMKCDSKFAFELAKALCPGHPLTLVPTNRTTPHVRKAPSPAADAIRSERLDRIHSTIRDVCHAEGLAAIWRAKDGNYPYEIRGHEYAARQHLAFLKELGIDAKDGHDALLKFEQLIRDTESESPPEPETPDEWRERQIRHAQTQLNDEKAKDLLAIEAALQREDIFDQMEANIRKRTDLNEEQKKRRVDAIRAVAVTRLNQNGDANQNGGESDVPQARKVL
jgi:hypothetical protein